MTAYYLYNSQINDFYMSDYNTWKSFGHKNCFLLSDLERYAEEFGMTHEQVIQMERNETIRLKLEKMEQEKKKKLDEAKRIS